MGQNSLHSLVELEDVESPSSAALAEPPMRPSTPPELVEVDVEPAPLDARAPRAERVPVGAAVVRVEQR